MQAIIKSWLESTPSCPQHFLVLSWEETGRAEQCFLSSVHSQPEPEECEPGHEEKKVTMATKAEQVIETDSIICERDI